jgi:molecular chaperone DnaK (HSP70)
MRKSLQAAERKIANLERTLNRFADHHSKTEQRALERARKELQAQLANAAEQGDARTVQQITDEIVDLEKSATPAAAGQPDGLDEALQEFKAANSWWEKDKAMTGAAREIAQELADAGITDYRVQLREVAKRIREEFPHKFTNPRRKEPGAVEADTSPPKSRGKGYSDLPPEAKAICDDFVKRGVLTKERYVKEFFA